MEAPNRTQLQLRNLRWVNAHLAAEKSNDVEAIVATFVPECRFAMASRAEGAAPVFVATDKAGARAHYTGVRAHSELVDTLYLRELVSDWCVFFELVSTLRHVGERVGITRRGDTYRVSTAVLFVVAEDGVVAEIPWRRFDRL